MYFLFVFFFKQKTAYEMRISDWSSDVCSSDLEIVGRHQRDDRNDGEEVEVGHEADEDGQEAHEHDNSGGPDDLVTQLASSLAFLRNLLGLFGQKVNQPLRRPQQAPVVAAPPDELQAHRQAAFGMQQRDRKSTRLN